MRKLFLALCAPALLLSACGGERPTTPGSTAPASQVEQTVDTGLTAAWKTFDLALDALDLIPESVIPKGSPRGKAIAAGIQTVKRALQKAETLTAGTLAYKQALQEAAAGIDQIRSLVKG